jgi:hypothetical protein
MERLDHIDHILIDRIWHSKYTRCPLAKVRERLAVSYQTMPIFCRKRFSLKK